MSFPLPSRSAPPILGVEATIKEVFQLYGAKFKEYATISFWATLWLWLWLVPTIAVAAFFVAVKNYYALLALIIPALVVLLVYCFAKYQLNEVLITRLAFGELTDRPESIEEAQRFMRPRMWRLFLAVLMLGLLCVGGITLLYLVMAVVGIAVLFALGGPEVFRSSGPNPGAVLALLVLLLLFLVVLLLLLVLSLWLGARFCLYTTTIAVEPEIKPAESLSRSWSLTQGNVWRIVLVLVVMALAISPIAGMQQWIALSVQQAFVGPISRRGADSGLLLLSTLVGMAINFGVQIVTMPVGAVMRAAIYRSVTRSPDPQ